MGCVISCFLNAKTVLSTGLKLLKDTLKIQNPHQHPLSNDVLSDIFSRCQSPETVLNASQVCKSWRNAVDFKVIEKILPSRFLKSPTGEVLKELLTPLDILRYWLQQNNNFIHGRYRHIALKRPYAGEQLIAMRFLNNDKLIRVFNNYLYLTDLSPNATSYSPVVNKFSKPIRLCVISPKGDKALLIPFQAPAKIVNFKDNLEDLVMDVTLPHDIDCAAFSSESDHLATISYRGVIESFDFRQNRVNYTKLAIRSPDPNSIYFSGKNHAAIALLNGSLLIWDYSQQLPPQEIAIAHSSNQRERFFHDLSFSPSGTKILVKGRKGKYFFIDLNLKKPEAKEIAGNAHILPNNSSLYSEKFHFSPDEHKIIRNDFIKNTIFLIDLTTPKKQPQLLKQLNSLPNLRTIDSHLSPDGSRLILIKCANRCHYYLDILNLFNNNNINQESVQIPNLINICGAYIFKSGVIFSPHSGQIILDTHSSTEDQNKQILFDFSPKINKSSRSAT